MSNSLSAVTVDCTDARAVAEFWAAATGRQIAEEGSTSEHVVLLPCDGAASGPRLVFNTVPEPKTVKNRVHLDLTTGTFSAEAERLLAWALASSPTTRETHPAGRPSPTSKATSSTSSPDNARTRLMPVTLGSSVSGF